MWSEPPVAPDFDSLCNGRTGPELVELVFARHPDHKTDPLHALFCCTYAKAHGGDSMSLHDAGKARVMRDYLGYCANESARDLPLYFVRCLLPYQEDVQAGPA